MPCVSRFEARASARSGVRLQIRTRRIPGRTAIKNVMWIDELPSILHMLMGYADHIYLDTNENYRAAPQVNDKNLRFTHELMSRYPLHQYHRGAKIMFELRQVKSDAEVALMKEAIRITDLAFRRILKFIKPGVMEYEIEAEISHEFLRNRCTGHAYSPIIASGKNACVLHYIENNQRCNDGDLLLLDFGADYANYAADLTRTIPVNGKFSPRQKDVYNAVLRVHRQAASMLRPGTIINEYHKEVGKLMEQELIFANATVGIAYARQRVMQRHRVLNLMTHVDPYRRPDADHARAATS